MRRTKEVAPVRYGEAYVSALRQHVASVKQAVAEIEEQIAALEGMVEEATHEATHSRDPPEPRGPMPRASAPPGIPVHLLGPTAQEQAEAPAQDAKRARYLALRDGGFVAVGLDESAYETFRGWQKPALVVIAIAAVASLIIWPVPFLIAFNAAATLCYFAIIAFRFFTIQRGERKAKTVLDIADDDVCAVDDATLPIYTILSPLYQEAETVVQFLRAMAQMDYPFEKLDIRVLLEEDDTETRTAALREKARMGNPEAIQIIVVPDALPKTKPKACNYGLWGARGDYLVIYDAEDIPEPDQLKKALIAFARLPEETVCIQAKLNYFNAEQNLLTRFFTAEYSMWFDLFLPGLFATGAPIPLGGTSNHFKMSALRTLGGWDPFNVAEDADLGMRIVRGGMRTAVMDSTTWEEANSRVGNWIRQRSRWVKGYMQVWVVAMRHPFGMLRTLGLWRTFGFHATVGGTPFVLLLNPLYWLLTVLYALTAWGLVPRLFPTPIFLVSLLTAVIGNLTFIYLSICGLLKRERYALVPLMFLSPFYWVLQSIAAWKAFYQLLVKPHYWEKTTHNLSALPHVEPQANPVGGRSS
jgi:glycosyltransferase XagB